MVCKVDDWDPLHAGVLHSQLNEQCVAEPTHLSDVTLIGTYSATFGTLPCILITCGPDFDELLSSPPATPPVTSHSGSPVCRVVGQNYLRSSVLLDLLDYNFRVSQRTSKGTRTFSEVDYSLWVPFFVDLFIGETITMKNRNRQVRGDRIGDRTDRADSFKTTRISLSFPISVGLPSLSAQNHCSLSHSPSSTLAHDRDRQGAAWKMETSRDKQLSHSPSKLDHLSSSTSSPIDLTAPIRNKCKSALSFSVARSDPQFQRSSSRLHSEQEVDYSEEAGGGSLPNGTNSEHSTTETAHILFNLSARAYQSQGTGSQDSLKGKKGKGNGLHVQLSLPQHGINRQSHPPSPPPSPPSLLNLTPPSLTPPPPPALCESSREMPKPELLCGVCHRLFSTASSLTIHMRLHRGGRALSCQHCGKAFIHNKRLQSHEATCMQAQPVLPVQPKQEPLEEAKVDRERVIKVEGPAESAQEPVPSRPIKKGRGLMARQRMSFSHSDLLGEGDHFVKVVDGHIIYFCTVCERSYMTLSSLKRHSNVHSWRRKYPCHYCDKVFALAEYRTKHEVWHTGERRYQCIFCWEAFATYYNLKTHQKAFHGINPGLISSEKTANGGYKQKVNALKLYRLLPMRSQKRPYKTYSQSLADGLLLQDSSINLDCTLPTSLDPTKLQSIINNIHTKELKPDLEGVPISVSLEQGKTSKPAASQTSMPARISERDRSDAGQSGNSSGRVKPPKGNEAAVSSVITFGHTKPSVIVHGNAVSSSVIVHSNQISSGNGKISLDIPSPKDTCQTTAKATQYQTKKHLQREQIDIHKEQDAAGLKSSEGSEMKQSKETGKLHKGGKAHSKSQSAKTVPVSGGSEVKGSGPLCQITVRIGEEAIVKRSISETDLIRDKNPSDHKVKKGDPSQEIVREPRHTHHHRHKHRTHRSSSQEDVEPRRKTPKTPGKVREYYFRQEVREQDSDHDGEDNLWRPYYSYKPKRKIQHMQKVKSWQRKMHYKRSLRLMRRAERLMNHVNKEVEGREEDNGSERDGDEVKEENSMVEKSVVHLRETSDTPPVTSKVEYKEAGTKGKDCQRKLNPPTPSISALPPPNPLQNTSLSSAIRQERHWPMDQASECGTCGRWFSSPRKRDKHELTHLLEFVCLLCRAPFSSQTKLEEHQRNQHPKPKRPSAPGMHLFPSPDGEEEMEIEGVSETERRKVLEKSSLGRLGRKPLVRHTCSKCDKVCKTAAALHRHLKRHELGSSAEVEYSQPRATVLNLNPEVVQATQSKDSDAKCDRAQPIPVINYPKPDSQPIESSQVQTNFCEVKAEHLTEGSCKSPEPSTFDKLCSPTCAKPSSGSLSPTVDQSKVTSSSLHSILVMNGTECLDYRTPEKRNLDALDQRKNSPAPTERSSNNGSLTATASQIKTNSTAAVSLETQSVRQDGLDQEVASDIQTQGDIGPTGHFNALLEAQDLRVSSLSRSPSSQAQDLSMPTILAQERALAQRATGTSNIPREQTTDTELTLRVPKEEPLSPVPSPTCSVVQTTTNGPSHKHSKSPHYSPDTLDQQALLHPQDSSPHCGGHGTERQGLQISGGTERPSEHALLLPQASLSEPEDNASVTPTDSHREASYPIQEFPLPLIVPGGYRSGKKQEDNILMSYPAGPLPFGPLGKMVPHSDSAKLPFFPDSYHLFYGPQLLAYPYNLAALPMALNMMAPGDKVEPLPFLPAFFNYAAPYAGTVPHPLVVNPNLYNSRSDSSKKRDSSNP
ncbi:zinc finger and BTB domain-containing protein 38 [Chanos chanos]|uniref:Zinc finger and BTB domain-containing protein 38 n=1 Tax=Chanos chanos TaxID=29144 RepID=A0A6J2VIM8_CHACN|nr:zinc finger and BTB domain-containing protein 38-like [Chanos chanos]